MKKLSGAIVLSLIDGQPHRVGDLLPYWRKRVEPTIATHYRDWEMFNRNKAGRRRKVKGELDDDLASPTPPTQANINEGADICIRQILWRMRKRNVLTVDGMPFGKRDHTDSAQTADLVVKLTDESMKALRLAQSDSAKDSLSQIWKEMRHAYVMGWIKTIVPVWNGMEE